MRMEAKNSYFKHISQVGNFKNIALTVAARHQKLMCSLFNSKDFFGRSFYHRHHVNISAILAVLYACTGNRLIFFLKT